MSSADKSADMNRRLESTIRLGTIAAVNHGAALCQVKSGGLLTEWLPWLERRAGTTRDWDPPTVGEQCLLLSPSGEPGAGIVISGIPSNAHPAPSGDEKKQVRDWPDGARYHYDHASHEWQLEVPDGGCIRLKIGATTLELRGDGTTLATPKFTGVQS